MTSNPRAQYENNKLGKIRRDLQKGLARSVSSADWARLIKWKGNSGASGILATP